MCLTPIQHPSYRDCSRGYATGTLSLKEVARKAQAAGLVYRKSGTKLLLGEPISAMYIDKLDSMIGGEFYDKFASEWREEQLRLQREIDRHEAAEQSYMDEGVQILELARNAQSLFQRQEPGQKRPLLNFVLSNCFWEDGEVRATFRQPFDLLAQTTAIAACYEAKETAELEKSEIWLPGPDSN